MTALLPPVPLATMTLALGALGGVTGAHLAMPAEDIAPIVAAAPAADAALLSSDDRAAPGKAGRHVVRRAADGMFYVWARANGRRIRFLVDTGASVVVLTANDAAAIGARVGAYQGRMQTAGGDARMAWTRIAQVEVGDRQVGGVRAAVIRNGAGVSLLGANMLSRMGPVRITGDQLELG